MDKQTLNELHQICDDFYTLNEDNLTDKEASRLFEIKKELQVELTHCEYTNDEFITWASQEVKYQVSVTKTLRDWLLYLCRQL